MKETLIISYLWQTTKCHSVAVMSTARQHENFVLKIRMLKAGKMSKDVKTSDGLMTEFECFFISSYSEKSLKSTLSIRSRPWSNKREMHGRTLWLQDVDFTSKLRDFHKLGVIDKRAWSIRHQHLVQDITAHLAELVSYLRSGMFCYWFEERGLNNIRCGHHVLADQFMFFMWLFSCDTVDFCGRTSEKILSSVQKNQTTGHKQVVLYLNVYLKLFPLRTPSLCESWVWKEEDTGHYSATSAHLLTRLLVWSHHQ